MLTTCCLRGYKAYHLQKSTCGACSYSAKCKNKCNWSAKADRQNSTETAKNHKPQIQAWIPGEKKNTCTQAGSCCSIQFMRISTISHTSNVLAVKYIKRKEKKTCPQQSQYYQPHRCSSLLRSTEVTEDNQESSHRPTQWTRLTKTMNSNIPSGPPSLFGFGEDTVVIWGS